MWLFTAALFIIPAPKGKQLVFSNRWMVGQTVIHLFSAIPLSNEKESCYFQLQGWLSSGLGCVKEPRLTRLQAVRFHLRDILGKATWRQKTDQWFLGAGDGEGNWWQKGVREFLGWWESFTAQLQRRLHDRRSLSKHRSVLEGWTLPYGNYISVTQKDKRTACQIFYPTALSQTRFKNLQWGKEGASLLLFCSFRLGSGLSGGRRR